MVRQLPAYHCGVMIGLSLRRRIYRVGKPPLVAAVSNAGGLGASSRLVLYSDSLSTLGFEAS